MGKTLVKPKIGETTYTNEGQILIYTRHERSDYSDSLEVKRIGGMTKSLSFDTVKWANDWLNNEGFNFEIDLVEDFKDRITRLENDIKHKESELEKLKWEQYFYEKNREVK